MRKYLIIFAAAFVASCAEMDMDMDAAEDKGGQFMFVLRAEADEFVLEKFDNARRAMIRVSRSDKTPAQRLIQTFPADYRMAFAWEDNYPRFEGVNYKAFDEYATTIQNSKYAFVFSQGVEIATMSGELYFVNKEKKSAHLLKNDMYDFQLAGRFMFYLETGDAMRTLTVYDLDTFETVAKIRHVVEIGFLPRQ